MKKQISKNYKINIDKLREPDVSNRYRENIKDALNIGKIDEETPNITWNRITSTCKEVAKEILGHTKPNVKTSNTDEIKNFSKKQKKLRDDAESCRNKEKRLKFKKERNKTLREMKRKLNKERNKALDEQLKEIEKYKNDTSRYYQAIRKVNSIKPKKALIIYDDKFSACHIR